MSNPNRLLLAGILTGTFLVPVNSTMITIGLTTIADSFGRSVTEASWIITIYLIVMAATQSIAGKLGDIFGYKRMFLMGLGLSLAGSIACAFSFNLWSMILFRSLQALGGSLAVPNATALIRFAIEKEKLSRTFGLFGLLMGMGAAVGPLIGSLLMGTWGWTSIFWVNIPFLFLSFAISWFVLPATPKRSASVDILGSLYLTAGLTIMVLFITHPEFIRWWGILLLSASVLLFIYREKRFTNPLIEFGLFRERSFRGANLGIFLSNSIMYGTILLIPILFEQQFSMGIERVGGLLFVFSAAMSFCSWLGGWLSGVIGHQKVILLSFSLQFLSLCFYLGLSQDSSSVYTIFSLIIGGVGSGIGLPSLQTANLESVQKEKTGVASGVYSTFRYMGGMMASALISILYDSHAIFYVMMGVAVTGVLISWSIGKNTSIPKRAGAKESNVS